MARPGASNVSSADAKANVANYFCAETPFQLSQDVDLRDLLEFVMQGRLEHTDIKNTFSQDDRGRMGRDKIADNLAPGIHDFRFVQTVAQAEPLHHLWKQPGSRVPSVLTSFVLPKTPLFDESGCSDCGVHHNANVA